jgi:hypothetical protein
MNASGIVVGSVKLIVLAQWMIGDDDLGVTHVAMQSLSRDEVGH